MFKHINLNLILAANTKTMRLIKLITTQVLLALLLQVNTSFASSVIVPVFPGSNTTSRIPVNYFKASEFVKLSAKDFSQLTGKKLNVFQRLSFRLAKLKMKHDLKKNPDLLITDYTKGPYNNNKRFSFLWFILGIAGVVVGLMTTVLFTFLLCAFAPVIIAYATKQDRGSIKSVWIGFGVGMLLLFMLIIIVIASIGFY